MFKRTKTVDGKYDFFSSEMTYGCFLLISVVRVPFVNSALASHTRDLHCQRLGERGKWRHFRREPTTSYRRRRGPQPISFVNGIDFRGGVVPPSVHPPTIPRRWRLATGGSRVHQTWRTLTVGARNGLRVDGCACALGVLVRVRACVHCMRI